MGHIGLVLARSWHIMVFGPQRVVNHSPERPSGYWENMAVSEPGLDLELSFVPCGAVKPERTQSSTHPTQHTHPDPHPPNSPTPWPDQCI